MNKSEINKGFSLLEMLIYIAVLMLMLVVVINATISTTRSQRGVKTSRDIENSAITALERINRELRQADSINISSSVLNSTPGKIVLDGTDQDGDPRTVEFVLSTSTVFIKENGINLGAITISGTKVTSLLFRRFASSTAEGIRTEIVLESGTSTSYRRVNFYSSATLR